MSQELGDYNVRRSDAQVITEESDGTGSAGDVVTVNSSGQVSQYTSDGADFYGVLAEDSPSSSGEDVAVVRGGDCIVNASSSLTKGDLIELDGATNGRAAQNANGTERAVDEGGTDTFTAAYETAMCTVDAGGTLPNGNSLGSNEAVIEF